MPARGRAGGPRSAARAWLAPSARLWTFAVLLCPAPTSAVVQDLRYLHAAPVMNLTLFDPDREHDLGALSRLGAVAQTAHAGFLEGVAPGDLARGATHEDGGGFAERTGFLNWQKRIFSRKNRVKVDELDWNGEPIPKFKQLPKDWPELYDSADLQMLGRRLVSVCTSYQDFVGVDPEDRGRFRLFIWAEIYGEGDSQGTHVHTGAAISGMVAGGFLDGRAAEDQVVIFEDPRGKHPPFGQSHAAPLRVGEVLLGPAWLPHRVPPHGQRATGVFWHFLAWPVGGVSDFDWEDDKTGDYILSMQAQVDAAPTIARGAGTARDAGAERSREEL